MIANKQKKGSGKRKRRSSWRGEQKKKKPY